MPQQVGEPLSIFGGVRGGEGSGNSKRGKGRWETEAQ